MSMFNNSEGITFEELTGTEDNLWCFPTSTRRPSSLRSGDQSVSSFEENGPRTAAGALSHQKIIRGSNGFDFVRQPCKARSIEVNSGQNPHVAKFAYIDIPVGTENGTILSCSHPVCSSSGRRFRYCNHCKTAVAKRNFNVRHAHADVVKGAPTTTTAVGPKVKTYYDFLAADFGAEPTSNNIGAHFEIQEVPSAIAAPIARSSPILKQPSSSDVDTSSKWALNSQEIDFINLLRCRPGSDCPQAFEHWKATLLTLTEKRPLPPVRPTTAVYQQHFNKEQTPEATPYDAGDDYDSVSSFDMEAFENYDFLVDCDVFEG